MGCHLDWLDACNDKLKRWRGGLTIVSQDVSLSDPEYLTRYTFLIREGLSGLVLWEVIWNGGTQALINFEWRGIWWWGCWYL